MEGKILRSVGTHDGTFHADEVTACALLALFNCIDKDKIVRTRDPALLAKCEYVCDVGGRYDPSQKLFDHHQLEYDGPLSSAGMVLAYLRDQKLITEGEYHFFNNSLIIGVDDHDNGRAHPQKGHATFSHILANFVPVDYEAGNDVVTAAFKEAFDFVYFYLKRLHERYAYTSRCRDIVAQCMKKYTDCLIFDKNIPWLESFFELDGENHPARFIIMPSGDHWKLRAIPPTYEKRMQVRHPLPAKWAGLLEGELKKVSGIPGAIFCHKGRFISVWETKKDALKALDYVLKGEK